MSTDLAENDTLHMWVLLALTVIAMCAFIGAAVGAEPTREQRCNALLLRANGAQDLYNAYAYYDRMNEVAYTPVAERAVRTFKAWSRACE